MNVASRRVVITGMGMVTARGNSLADTLSAVNRHERADGRIVTGDAANGRIVAIDASGFSSDRGREIVGFDPQPHFRIPKALKLTDRTTQWAVAAAGMALDLAGWPGDAARSARLGVLIGVSGSDLQTSDLAAALKSANAPVPVGDIRVFADRILSGLSPLWLLVNLPNMPSAHVAIQIGARGPNSTIMTDWVAGSQAIGEAADWIRAGEADAVLAGGADSAIQPFALAAYDQSGLLTSNEDGTPQFIPSEGAAVVLLEDATHAENRGATVLGEIHGYASASSPADARAHALARTMIAASREAGWAASDLAAIALASLDGTPLRARERSALLDAFGHDADTLPHLDYQPAVGHALAALGPISLCLALSESADARRIICNAAGHSGQAVTLAVQARPSSRAAS